MTSFGVQGLKKTQCKHNYFLLYVCTLQFWAVRAHECVRAHVYSYTSVQLSGVSYQACTVTKQVHAQNEQFSGVKRMNQTKQAKTDKNLFQNPVTSDFRLRNHFVRVF